MFNLFKNGKGELLNLMFLNPEKRYYLAEVARILGKEPSAYQQYVENFITEGLFYEERIGNMRFFWLNKNYHLYSELKSIISKTTGVEGRLKEVLDKNKSIDVAFIFGSYATDKFNTNSDIDLFIIGKEEGDNFIQDISSLEMSINRRISYHFYSKKEVFDKISIKDNFVYNVFNRNIILLKGSIDEYTKS